MPKGVYLRTEAHKQKLRDAHVGYVRTAEHIAAFNERIKERRIPFQRGKNNPSWAADKVSYSAIHCWISKNYGRPKQCEQCSTENASVFDWANISGSYKRERSDWKRLCRSCHTKFDNRGFKVGNTASKKGKP